MALLGVPNAGKSTLLNALIGQKLSIVTPKAQTTRQNVTGIRSEGDTQAIFLDTPGLLDPGNLLQRSMQGAAGQAIDDADVLVLVVDGSVVAGASESQGAIVRVMPDDDRPKILAINKIDRAHGEAVDVWSDWARSTLTARPLTVSALRGTGMDDLWDTIAEALPESPFFYDPDDLSTENLRFFVAELVRETAMEALRQEVPYGLAVAIEEFREDQDPVYIGATIFVERNSQKGIVVGKGGALIRELGRRSREKIESLLERRVYLDLWVKVLPSWRSRSASLKRLGFAVPEDDAQS